MSAQMQQICLGLKDLTPVKAMSRCDIVTRLYEMQYHEIKMLTPNSECFHYTFTSTYSTAQLTDEISSLGMLSRLHFLLIDRCWLNEFFY